MNVTVEAFKHYKVDNSWSMRWLSESESKHQLTLKKHKIQNHEHLENISIYKDKQFMLTNNESKKKSCFK